MFADHPHHIVLPHANGDNGNTPRAIGGMLADSYGYDAVAYLDADNWYLPSHIAGLVAAFEKTRNPMVASKRLFCDLDGQMMAITDADDEAGRHVDTSCWLVFRPAFSMLRAWLMPKVLGPFCDRIFFQKAMHERFGMFLVDAKTMVFRTQYVLHYLAAKRSPPPSAKGPAEYQQQLKYLSDPAVLSEFVAKLGFFPVFR
jgi:hypothetical protein